MTCIYHYSIKLSVSTVLKFLCLPIHPSPQLLQPLIVFYCVSIVLLFPECPIVGIIQYIALPFYTFFLYNYSEGSGGFPSRNSPLPHIFLLNSFFPLDVQCTAHYSKFRKYPNKRRKKKKIAGRENLPVILPPVKILAHSSIFVLPVFFFS